MAYIIKKGTKTITYDTSSNPSSTSSIEGYKVTQNSDDSSTYQPFGKEYTYYVNIPRRCSRCRKYELEGGICKLKKDWKTCKKNYSIKKNKK